MDEFPDANAAADEEAELLEQMPPPEFAGFDALVVRVSPSGDYIVTRDTCRKKRRSWCSVLHELHRITSTVPSITVVRIMPTQNKDPQAHRVSPPRPYVFNHDVGSDVFEVVDAIAKRLSILSAVCMGTTSDQAWIVRESESLGSPSSHECLKVFLSVAGLAGLVGHG